MGDTRKEFRGIKEHLLGHLITRHRTRKRNLAHKKICGVVRRETGAPVIAISNFYLSALFEKAASAKQGPRICITRLQRN